MTIDDIERGTTHKSPESSNSFEAISTPQPHDDHVSLLPPDHLTGKSLYSSTETAKFSTDAISQNENPVEEFQEAKPNSAFSILSLLLIGVFISSADGTFIMATYTTISSEFHAFGAASWLTTSFILAQCAFQPIVGKLSDIYGRKGVLLTSYAIFALGSIGTGVAMTMVQVVGARIVSGIGSAGMVVIVSVLITDLVPIIQVASWKSYVNVISTLGRSIGGPLGGLLADTIGWRWSFVGQGPVILLAIILVALKLPSMSHAAYSPQNGQPSRLRRIDFIGAFILAGTIISFLLALSLGGQNLPWQHPLIISLILGSVALGVFFVGWEVKCAFEPVFPPNLLVMRDVATPYAICAMQIAAQVAMMFSVPLYFRVTVNASNTVAGTHLFPAVVGNTVGGLLSGFLIQKTGKYKLLTIIAALSSTLSYLILITRWHGETSWLESLEVVPGGFGCGMAFVTTFVAVTASVEKDVMAIATGGLYLASSIGMLAGLSVSSSVQVSTLRALLYEALSGPETEKIVRNVMTNVESIRYLEEGIRTVVVTVYVKSLEHSHVVSLVCSILALILALTLREHSLKKI